MFHSPTFKLKTTPFSINKQTIDDQGKRIKKAESKALVWWWSPGVGV